MNSKSYKDFATVLKNTFLCKRRSPLEFYYKLDLNDDYLHSNIKYTTLYTPTNFTGCSFKGYIIKTGSVELVIGLETTGLEEDTKHLNVQWNVSIYDTVQEAFISLGRSEFKVFKKQENTDTIIVPFTAFNSYVTDNNVLLKWNVDKLKESSEYKGRNTKTDDQCNYDIDSSLESLLAYASKDLDEYEESVIKDVLHTIKQDIDSCRKQQKSNGDKLQLMEETFQEVDVRLSQLLDRILSQEQLTSESNDINSNSRSSIDSENGDIGHTQNTNCQQNLLHAPQPSGHTLLKRTTSDPLLYKISSNDSFKDNVMVDKYVTIQPCGSSLSDKAANVAEFKNAYTQTELDIPTTSYLATDPEERKLEELFDPDKDGIEMSVPSRSDLKDTDEKNRRAQMDVKEDSMYKRILFIGFDIYLMREIIFKLFQKQVSIQDLYSKMVKGITIKYQKIKLYVIFFKDTSEMTNKLLHLLSVDKDLKSMEFHACILALRNELYNFIRYCDNESILKTHCIIIFDGHYGDTYFFKGGSFDYFTKCLLVYFWEHTDHCRCVRDLCQECGYYCRNRILRTIDMMHQDQTFQISQMFDDLYFIDYNILSMEKDEEEYTAFAKIKK